MLTRVRPSGAVPGTEAAESRGGPGWGAVPNAVLVLLSPSLPGRRARARARARARVHVPFVLPTDSALGALGWISEAIAARSWKLQRRLFP